MVKKIVPAHVINGCLECFYCDVDGHYGPSLCTELDNNNPPNKHEYSPPPYRDVTLNDDCFEDDCPLEDVEDG